MKISKSFESTLEKIRKFSPGYRSTTTMANLFSGEWNTKNTKWTGEPVSPEYALFLWESRGIDSYSMCTDKKEFVKLIEQKDSMNLTIAMWKETIYDAIKNPSNIALGWCTISDCLKDGLTVEWLRKINLFMVDGKNYENVLMLGSNI